MRSFLNSSPRKKGFTLVELLVSMVILALLLVFVAQLTSSATNTTTASRKRIDADAQARMIFDKMAHDFARMVRRSDVDFLAKGTAAPNSVGGTMTGNDQIAFYSSVDGYYGSSAPSSTPTRNQRNPVSLLGYFISTDSKNRPQLVRLSKGLGWEPNGTNWEDMKYLPVTISTKWPNLFNTNTSPTNFSGMVDPDFQTIGEAVTRFEYLYLLKPQTGSAAPALSVIPYDGTITPTHTSKDFCRDVAAIVVALTIVDPTSRVIISDYSKLKDTSVFSDAAAGGSIDQGWIASINSGTFALAAGIPATAASAVRVYQRTFYLNPTP